MATKYEGLEAPWVPDICTWCTGKDVGTLFSDSFNSCAGMVLYGPTHRIGVVAHFSGSMGTMLPQVRNDVLEILRDVCPIAPGFWNGWVFGGKSLLEKVKHDNVEKMTKPLMDTIRATMKTNPYIPINLQLELRLLYPRKFGMRPNPFSAKELQPNSYEGHKGVRLNLANGAISYVDDKVKAMF